MKFLTPTLLCLLSSVSVAAAVSCGTAISKPCMAESDIRYDSSTGYDLKDQSPFWRRLAGYYKGYDTLYNVVGNVPTPDSEEAAVLTYLNITVAGSRIYMHRYSFRGGGGQNNSVGLLDTYLSGTFEKDGSVRELGRNGNELDKIEPFVLSEHIFEGRASGPYTGSFVGELDRYVSNIAQEFYTCVETNEDEPCSQLLSQVDMYLKWGGKVSLDRSKRLAAERLTEESWLKEVTLRLAWYDKTKTYDPATDECATKECPTEEQWAKFDPYLRSSPYEEPEGSLEGWFVGLIVVICVLVVCVALYMVHHFVVSKREERIKAAFAQSVAASIAHRCKAEDLTPDDLRKEFELIDEDNSGKVSKEEFHNFIMSSEKVELDARDFDVLYSTIDTNGDGEIDFSEFCAFFNLIKGNFNSAMKEVSPSSFLTKSVTKDNSPAGSVAKDGSVSKEDSVEDQA